MGLDDDAIVSLAGRAAVNHERRQRGELVGFGMPEGAVVDKVDGLSDDEQVAGILRCFEPEVRAVHLDELQIRTDLMVRTFEFRRLMKPIRELLLERDTLNGREVHRLARRVGRSRRMKLRIWITYRARRIAHGAEHTFNRIVYTILRRRR